MLHRRIIYFLILAAALLFQITNENYLAHLVLVLTIALPLLSLALSLPGMLSCRLSLSAVPDPVYRGQQGLWRIAVEDRLGLPLGRLYVRLEARSLFTGETERYGLSLFGVSRRLPLRRRADTGHCGLLELRCVKFRVWDFLGLFSVRRKAALPARLLVEPVPVDPGPLNFPDCQGMYADSENAARKGPGEDYDLRGYRPGDPLRRVHWKLSTKWDELIVREPLESAAPLPLLTFDHFGTPEEVDRVLDRLTGYSRAMLELQQPHAILWLDPADGAPCRCGIVDEKDLRDCQAAILSQPCPASGPSILDRLELLPAWAGMGFHVHVTAGKGADGHEG